MPAELSCAARAWRWWTMARRLLRSFPTEAAVDARAEACLWSRLPLRPADAGVWHRCECGLIVAVERSADGELAWAQTHLALENQPPFPPEVTVAELDGTG